MIPTEEMTAGAGLGQLSQRLSRIMFDPAVNPEVDRVIERARVTNGMIEWFPWDIRRGKLSAHIPAAYHVCDGRAVSRRENPRLFDLYGTDHGVGDGERTFNLPDLTLGFRRRVVDIGALPNSTIKDVLHGVVGFVDIWIGGGFAKYAGIGTSIPLPRPAYTQAIQVELRKVTTDYDTIRIGNNADWSDFFGYIFVDYTVNGLMRDNALPASNLAPCVRAG